MSNNENKLVPKLRFPEFHNDGEWVIENLENNIDLFSGIAFKSEEISDDESGIPILRGINITEGYIRHSKEVDKYFVGDLENLKKYLVKKNDIVIGMDGSKVGKNVALIKKEDENSILIQRVARIRTNEKSDINYIYHHFISDKFRNYVDTVNTSSGIPHISAQQIKDFQIGFPPKLKEQRKIATCLSSLDEVITAESQKLDILKDHKKGLLQNLLPQEGETVPKFRFKEFEDSGEWEEKTLGDVAESLMYGMNAAAVEFDGENKYIRITDINENTRLFSPNPLTSPEGQLDEKYRIKVGDILFARTGASVGKSYLHQEESGKIYFAGFLIRLTVKNAVPYFVYLQTLTVQYQKWVSKTSMRSGQPGINAEEYKSYSLLIPSDSKEQEKIANTLSSIEDLINAQNQKVQTLKLHKKGLLQGLFV